MAGGESGSVRVLKLRDSLEHLENWLRGHPNTSLTEPLFPGLEPFEAENALPPGHARSGLDTEVDWGLVRRSR